MQGLGPHARHGARWLAQHFVCPLDVAYPYAIVFDEKYNKYLQISRW